MRFRILFLIVVAGVVTGYAQYPEDALRLASPGIGIGPRAVGMGSAFLPLADDYTALFWNPAGLGQLNMREVTVGLSNANYGNSATFLSNVTTSSVNDIHIDDIGAVIPVDPRRNGFSIAIGYNRISSFSAVTSFNGFNQNSSLIGFEVGDARKNNVDPTTAMTYITGVAGSVNGVLTTPVNGRVQQSGGYDESGGVHAFSLGAGAEIAEGLDVGMSLHLYTGSYDYQRQFVEADVNNVYNGRDTVAWTNVDLTQYSQHDNIAASISGIGATFGLLYHWSDIASMGITAATPSSFHVHEDYSTSGQALFDNNDVLSNVQSGFDEYDVTTPLTVSGGFAVHPIQLLTVSAVADYIDYTQLRFSNADPVVTDQNSSMRTTFRAVLNYHGGVEYKIAPLGLGVRVGYQFQESAYAIDPSSEGTKLLSGGVSLVLAKKAVLDLAYVHGTTKAYHTNYDATSATTEAVTLNNVMLGISFRW